MYKSFVELKEVCDLLLVLIQNQSDVDSILVKIQSPGSFLCCFLLSTLSSLTMLSFMLSLPMQDVVFARMSVVVVYAIVPLSTSSFACLCSLVSAY